MNPESFHFWSYSTFPLPSTRTLAKNSTIKNQKIQRPCQVDCAGSRYITTVKQTWAWLLLRRVTAWKQHVLLACKEKFGPKIFKILNEKIEWKIIINSLQNHGILKSGTLKTDTSKNFTKRYHHRKLHSIHRYIHWEHCESTDRHSLWRSRDWCVVVASKQHWQTLTVNVIWLISCCCQQTALTDTHCDCHMTDILLLPTDSTDRHSLWLS